MVSAVCPDTSLQIIWVSTVYCFSLPNACDVNGCEINQSSILCNNSIFLIEGRFFYPKQVIFRKVYK